MRMSIWVLVVAAALTPLPTHAQSKSTSAAEFVPDPAAYGITPNAQSQPSYNIKRVSTAYCDAKNEPKPSHGPNYSNGDLIWFRVCKKQPRTLASRLANTAAQTKSEERSNACSGPSPAASCSKKDSFVSQDAESQPYCGIYVGPEKRGIFDKIPDSGNRPQEAINLLKQGYFASGRCVAELSAEDGNADAVEAVAMMREKHIGEGPQIEAERAKRKADAQQAHAQPANAQTPGLLGSMILGWMFDGGNTSIAPDHSEPAWACSQNNEVQNCTTELPANHPQ
jgi:hypothetical protein